MRNPGGPMRRRSSTGSDVVRALHAVGACRERHVSAIVDQEAGACSSRNLSDRHRQIEQISRGEILLPELDGPKPGADTFLHDLGERRAATIRESVTR